jgi:hypothetical protein
MRCLGLLLLGGLAVLTVPLASAQTPSLSNPGGPVVGTAPAQAGPPPPPPGLPGAASSNNSTSAPPPPSQAASPNDALFDAINRGDMAEARDAIARGAELDARNVLGMTPLELAVDLNRNDIAFLLLSIEHEHTAAAAGTNSALSLSVPPVPAAMPVSGSGNSGQPGLAGGSVADLLLANQPPVSAPRASVAKAALTPDPPSMAGTGSPDPAVGFLGFGPRAGGLPQN